LGARAGAGDDALLINGAPGSPYLTTATRKRAKVASGGDQK
jgi:hypothetical protein